jgi:glutathione peroxidase-family protein
MTRTLPSSVPFVSFITSCSTVTDVSQLNHGVSFPLMAKSDVNGDNMNEVFAWLKAQKAPNAEGIAGTTAIKVNLSSLSSKYRR